ncbi:hypothetical protein Tco_1004788 [Tanacetum coccineum]|uniref:Uncharacterized protein n=1 Tax=Tanacetum coccineum TaxID=301880 RepID=A0ABQ5FD17_9ASTR
MSKKEEERRIVEEQAAKEDMSIEEMRHEQQLVDYQIKDITNDLGYKSINPLRIGCSVYLLQFPIPLADSDSFFEESLLLFLIQFLLLEIPKFESFHFDPSFPRPPPEPPDVEISLVIKTDVPEINDLNKLNGDECFDQGGGEINFEADDSFTFVTWTFLPFLTYLEVSPLLSSTKNEDTIFDPGIFT